MANTHNKLSLHRFRVNLAQTEALIPLTLLGLITGLLAGGLLIGFRELVLWINDLLVPMGEESFELLAPELRMLFPMVGALLLILLIKLSPSNRRQFGIGHVIERLTINFGRLPLTNVVGQFVGALIALTSGFSVGREGPAVHMGAGAGSGIGQMLRLPNNTLTSLAGCGSAAAIAASFNTPMAGVIFAMEVIMKEYTLCSFIPVMTASVSAAMLSQMVYGATPAFQIPLIATPAMEEWLISALAALVIGALAALFIRSTILATKLRGSKISAPLMIAGLLMGLAGLFLPDVMGIGYDTIEMLLNSTAFDLQFLVILLLVKLFITAAVIGLGVPGGVIGPSLMMGALAGSLLGLLGTSMLGTSVANISFHGMVGMVAMMAAVLQAPLAALITVLEMTSNPGIIMPAMLAIIIACLTSSQLFRQRGLFEMQFLAKGIDINLPHKAHHLNRTGVACLMQTELAVCPPEVSPQKLESLMGRWVLIEKDYAIVYAIPPTAKSRVATDLLQHPDRLKVHNIGMQATLNDALQLMNQEAVDALVVLATISKDQGKTWEPCGIITRQAIDTFYHQ